MLLHILYSLFHERWIGRACSGHDGDDLLILLGQDISMSQGDIQDMLTVTNKFVLSDARDNHKKHENRPRRCHLNIGVLYMRGAETWGFHESPSYSHKYDFLAWRERLESMNLHIKHTALEPK